MATKATEPKKVYVVHGESGDYDDRCWWLVAVHRDQEGAEAHARLIEKQIRERNEAIDEDEIGNGRQWYDTDWDGPDGPNGPCLDPPPADPQIQPEWTMSLGAWGAVYAVTELDLVAD